MQLGSCKKSYADEADNALAQTPCFGARLCQCLLGFEGGAKCFARHGRSRKSDTENVRVMDNGSALSFLVVSLGLKKAVHTIEMKPEFFSFNTLQTAA